MRSISGEWPQVNLTDPLAAEGPEWKTCRAESSPYRSTILEVHFEAPLQQVLFNLRKLERHGSRLVARIRTKAVLRETLIPRDFKTKPSARLKSGKA